VNAAGDVLLVGRPDVGATSEILLAHVDAVGSGSFLAEQDDVPAPGPWSYEHLWQSSRPGGGEAAVYASTSNGPEGVFIVRSGTDSTVALEGDPKPGGGTFDIPVVPRINSRGDVLFESTLDDGREGLFVAVRGKIYLIAIVGDVAPGTGGGTFDGFGFAELNTSRQVVFAADVTGGSASGGVFLAEPPPAGAPAVSPGGLVVLATFVSFAGARALRASSGRCRGRVDGKNKPRIR